jgi:hypothetical protein
MTGVTEPETLMPDSGTVYSPARGLDDRRDGPIEVTSLAMAKLLTQLRKTVHARSSRMTFVSPSTARIEARQPVDSLHQEWQC